MKRKLCLLTLHFLLQSGPAVVALDVLLRLPLQVQQEQEEPALQQEPEALVLRHQPDQQMQLLPQLWQHHRQEWVRADSAAEHRLLWKIIVSEIYGNIKIWS